MKLAFCSHGYLSFPVDEAVKRISKSGYSGVELLAWRPHVYPRDLNEGERRRLRKLIKGLGLELVSLANVGGIRHSLLDFCSPRKNVREETVRHYKDVIELAVDLGSPMINMVSGYRLTAVSYEQAWGWNLECTRRIVDLAEKRGIMIALEPLSPWSRAIVNTSKSALRLKKELASRNVGVMLDTGQMAHAEPNIPKAIRHLQNDLVHIHLGDSDGSSPAHLPPGRGSVDFEAVAKALIDIGYKGDISCEVAANYPVDSDAWAIESKAYVDKILLKLGLKG